MQDAINKTYTVDELAEKFSVSTKTIRKWAMKEDGPIKAIQPYGKGSTVRYYIQVNANA